MKLLDDFLDARTRLKVFQNRGNGHPGIFNTPMRRCVGPPHFRRRGIVTNQELLCEYPLFIVAFYHDSAGRVTQGERSAVNPDTYPFWNRAVTVIVCLDLSAADFSAGLVSSQSQINLGPS